MGALKDLTGQRFGKLTVVCRAPDIYSKSGNKVTMWRCKCDCGGCKDVRSSCLLNGDTQSCGCSAHSPTKYRDAAFIRLQPPMPTTVQDNLFIGRYYKIKKKRRRLIGIYSNYARFEDEHGMKECFSFWELERMLRGDEA